MDPGFLTCSGVLVWLACGVAGYYAARERDAGSGGAGLGLLLGPLGVIAALGLDERPKCPDCSGRLDGKGKKCQWCQRELSWAPETEVDERGRSIFDPKPHMSFECPKCKAVLTAGRAGSDVKCVNCGTSAIAPQITFCCDTCTQLLVADQPGLRTTCPKCGKQVIVPAK